MQKNEVKQILSFYTSQRLGFSKLKVVGLDKEGGKVEKVTLKDDPIRIAQMEFKNERKAKRKEDDEESKLVVKSVQYGNRPLLDERRWGFGRQFQHEEDAVDCQEGNRTPFHHNLHKNAIKFHNQEMIFFQSPKNI